MLETFFGILGLIILVIWLSWVIVRLSWTDTFPITTWKDFMPCYKPEKFKG